MKIRRTRKMTFATLAGVTLLAAPVAACSDGPSYEEWAATDGAAGRINLDEVQKAFQDSKSATEFEEKVNEIYEGDGIILIRVEQDGEQMTLEGWEDLNSSKEIEDVSDDRLFSIVRGTNKEHDLRGYGSNSYYHSHFGAGDFFFTYLLLSSFSPGLYGGYYYRTPPASYDSINRSRSNYRGTSGYKSQVSRNTQYFNKQKTFAGSAYEQSGKNISSSRKSYMSSQRSSNSFKSSGTGVRSTWGSSSRSSSVGGSSRSGFSGGGGATRLTAFRRPSLRG